MQNQANYNETLNSTYPSDLKSLVTIISITTSSISLLACLFIIFIYIAFQVLRQYNFKLVFYLAFSLLINSIGNLIVTNDTPQLINANYCTLQAFFINFGGLSNVAWNLIICYYIRKLFNGDKVEYQIRESVALMVGFGIPLIMSIIPLLIEAYGFSNYICWISYHKPSIEFLLILIEFFLPLWLVFLFFILTICWTFFKDPLNITPQQMKRFSMIKLYPIILFLCWGWGSIDIIFDAMGSNYSIIKIFHVFFGEIQGFINAIFFFNTIEVKYILKTQLCAMLPCFYTRKGLYKQKLKDDINESKDENTENMEKKPKEMELIEAF